MTNNTLFRRTNIVAGIGLLLMAVLAGWSNFAVLERLIIPTNAAKTAQNVFESNGVFRLGVLASLLTTVLEVLVSWGVLVGFARVNGGLSRLTAWFRFGYAAIFLGYAPIFAVAIAQLFGVLQKLEQPNLGLEQAQILALIDTQNFKNIWDFALLLFWLLWWAFNQKSIRFGPKKAAH